MDRDFPPVWASLLEARTFRGPRGARLPYRLLRPDAPKTGRRYPLVLFLHGAGERGRDNVGQLRHGVAAFAEPEARRRFPCYLAVPQCPARERWVDVDWSAPGGVSLDLVPARPLRLALLLLEELGREFPVDDRRVSVTGLSMGGFGAWVLIGSHPERFAVAVPVCGGGDESQANRMTDTPIWAFHGALDDVVPPSQSAVMVRAVEEAGGRPRFTLYPDVGHDSWERAYREPELLPWLFAQRRP
jgi:predicted peptidase